MKEITTTPIGGSTGDAGGAAPVSAEDLAALKATALNILTQGAGLLYERRRYAELTLNCEWDGQSPDGRKRREYMKGEPFPFEGASDMRIREADALVNEATDLGCEVLRGMSIRGVEGGDDGLAARMERLASWVVENLLGDVWTEEWRLFLRWMNADAPARAVMFTWWERTFALVPRTLSREALIVMEAKANGGDTAAAVATVQAMLSVGAEKEATAWLKGLLGGEVRDKAVNRALRALRLGEEVEVPVPERALNRPCVQALRLMQDVFCPLNTPSDIQKARYILRRELLSRVELEERAHTMGYRASFIEKVLRHEGVIHLGVVSTSDAQLAMGDGWSGFADPQARQGLFEVITGYFRAVNEDGWPAVYHVAFHGSVDEAAHDREILPYAHGKYPFAWAASEMTSRAMASPRGIPELVMTDQWALKFLNDSFNDHASLVTAPPVKVPANRPDTRMTFGPFAKVREWRVGEIEFMNTGQYPAGNDKHREDIRKRTGEYFGRPGYADPALVQSRARQRAAVVTTVAREVLLQMLSLCQQYFDDEDLQRVTGRAKETMRFSREDIQGRYDLRVTFDTRTSNLEWIKLIGELIGKYLLPWDTAGVFDRAWLVEYFAGMIDPALLGGVRTVQDALKAEVNDEDSNLSKIIDGMEPDMAEDGQNFQARLQRLTDNLRKNPAIAAKMDDTSRAILDARVKHLQFMVKQRENALTGRVGAKSVFDEDGGA